jgi:drug/metabolite transporter (DMT)-like permease
MILIGLARGDRLLPVQGAGLALALAGLVALLLPGLTQPSWRGASLMVVAGVAWGLYSLRGRGNASPLVTTAGNFLRASLPAGVLALVMGSQRQWDSSGVVYAVISGALASGVGYALWYSALPFLRPTQAATVQLSVPVLAAMGGVSLLGEALTLRLVLCSAAVLGGIGLTLTTRRRAQGRST